MRCGHAGYLFHRAGLGVRILRLALRPGSSSFPGTASAASAAASGRCNSTLWQMMCVVAVAAFLILVFEKQLGSRVSFLCRLLTRSGVVRPRVESRVRLPHGAAR